MGLSLRRSVLLLWGTVLLLRGSVLALWLLLGLLVLDEEHLWLAGLSRGRFRDLDLGLLLGLLHQHVHQRLVLVLDALRDDGGGGSGRGRCLDEDNLVVLLRDRHLNLAGRGIGHGLLWRHVHVHVLGDDLLGLWRAILLRWWVSLGRWSVLLGDLWGKLWLLLLAGCSVVTLGQLLLLGRWRRTCVAWEEGPRWLSAR